MRNTFASGAIRVAGALLAIVAVSASGAEFSANSTLLTPDLTYSAPKSNSGRLAQTDPALLDRTDSTPINVLIKYDFDATATYAGGVKGLAPTSPAITNQKLKNNKSAVQAYELYTASVSASISSAVKAAVPSVRISKTFSTVYGGVAAQVPANKIIDLLTVPGVAAVQEDKLEHPQTSVTPTFTGAVNVWPLLGGQSKAAQNVVVGVIDTGIWPEHPSFAPNPALPAPPGGPYGCQFGDGSDVAHLGPQFACNRKLVGAYAFTDTYMANVGAVPGEFCNNVTGVCSPRDPDGHGTHTSSTAAGARVDTAAMYGVNRGPISGMAPGARVIMYRVCLAQGCFGSDSIAAVQQAILDDIDVINFSISGGANPYSDAVELAFLDAFNAGISVNAAAGNSGPGAATVDHGGPWVTTVGASTSNRFFTSTLHLTAVGGAVFNMPGVTITNGITSPTPVVLAQTLPGEDALCQSKLAPGTATGKIVMCQRGTNARVDKGFNVAAGGAAGMILYNPVTEDVETDNHWLPAIHVDGPPTALLAFVNGHANVMATWVQGTPNPTRGDVMAAFSSRGPQTDFIKPDVTAPGIQVLAGMTPVPTPTDTTVGPPGNLFQAIAGTSMATPHAAGISALVKAVHPDWTPAMIKSALMTSSVQDVVKEDGVTPATPFDDGAGSIRADRAINPTLVFDETYADFVASATDPLHRTGLNIASVNAPTMTGLITVMRTATNVSGNNVQLFVSTVAPAGATILVSDQPPGKHGPQNTSPILLHKKGTTALWITISAPELPNGQYFGKITLDPRNKHLSPVVIPVAFVKKQGIVTLSHVCAPTTFPANTGHAGCTASVANLGSLPANVSLTVTELNNNGLLNFENVSAPAMPINGNDGVQWSGALTPSIAPQVTAINNITGNGPAGGYLPLSLFGGNLTIPGGDDAITNVNVPTFYYGGEPYSKIGVVTNGYVVIGGGTGTDVNFFPQTFPNPARPNNVVAPFWTDLNTTGGSCTPSCSNVILVNALTDGTNNWIVVDFEAAKNFSNSTTHTGEIWIQYGGPATEGITISYGAANAAAGDPGSSMNWGAENRDGTSGLNLPSAPADNSEYAVILTPPTAGGTMTITYDAASKKKGTYKPNAAMTSDVTPGTTEVVQTLTVTP